MQPKKFSEYTPTTVLDGNEIIPIVKGGANSVTHVKDLPASTAVQAKLDLKANQADLFAHTSNTSNPHATTKAQVGLGNADNTSDAAKPVSTAQAAAIAVVQSDVDVHEADTANPHAVTKAQVGLGSVPNVDATQRANHTGTQLAATISDFAGAADARISAQKGVANGVATLDSGTKIPIGQLPALSTSIISEGSNLYYTDARVRLNRLDQMAVPTSALDLNGQRLTNLGAGVNPNDAVTMAQVDAVKQALRIKDSVRVATTANITLSGLQAIDGVTVIAGDRVLVKDQSTASQNGIYVAASGAWARAADANVSSEVMGGTYVFINEGSTNADSGWVLTTNDPIVLDTTNLAFTQFSGAGQITAGTGLSKTGNTISLITPVTLANGGTGGTSASTARASLGAVNIAGDTMTGALIVQGDISSTTGRFKDSDNHIFGGGPTSQARISTLWQGGQGLELFTGSQSAAGGVVATITGKGLIGSNIVPSYGIHTRGGGGRIQAMGSVTGAPTVTPQGATGSTSATYYVVAKDAAGNPTPPSPAGTTATGNATLDATNFNRVTWAAVAGAYGYDVLKGDTRTKIGTVAATSATPTQFDDIGQSTTGYTPVFRDVSGDLLVDGIVTGAQFDKGGALYNALAYGIKNDGVYVLDAAINTGTNVVNSASGGFAKAVVGQAYSIEDAGSGGGVLDANITAVNSANQIVISTNALTTTAGSKSVFGTDNGALIAAAIVTIKGLGGGILYFPPGIYGEKSNWTTSAALTSNIYLMGSVRGATTFVLLGNVGLVGFGDFNADNNNIMRNIKVSDITGDMLKRTSGFAQGFDFGNCQDVTVDNLEVKGGAGGCGYQLAFGTNSGGGSFQFARNLLVSNSIFGESSQTNEAVSMLQANFYKFVNCTFRNKSTTYTLLSYGGWNGSLVNCNFYGDVSGKTAGLGVNGWGGFNIIGCNFFGAGISIYGSATIDGVTMQSYGVRTSTSANSASNAVPYYGSGISISASEVGTSESNWESTSLGLGAVAKSRIVKISNTVIESSGNPAISSSLFLTRNGTYASLLEEIIIDNVNVRNVGHQGINLAADRITMRDVTVSNSDQFNLSTERYNISLSGAVIKLFNVRSYDDQAVPTTNYDILMDQQAATLSVFPQTQLYLENCDFGSGGIQYYNGGFTTTQPNNVNIYRRNNIGDTSSTYSIHELGGSLRLEKLSDPSAPTVSQYAYVNDASYNNGSTTLTSATFGFTAGDNGLVITGQYIPAGTTITYVNATTVTLSNPITGGNATNTIMRVQLARVGATTANYYVVAEDRSGNKSLTSAVGTTTTGFATLNAINTNKISWTPVRGAVKYYVLKNNTSTLLGTVTDRTTCSFLDTGQSTSGFTSATVNNSGSALIDNNLTVGSLKMAAGASNGYILKSDASGNAVWGAAGFVDISSTQANVIGLKTFRQTLNVGGDGVLTAYLKSPITAEITVTPQGTTGSTTYYYKVVGINHSGADAFPSGSVSTTTGNATLSASNFNRVVWTTSFLTYAPASYRVLRSTDNVTFQQIGTTTGITFDDIGQTPSAYTAALHSPGSQFGLGDGTLTSPTIMKDSGFHLYLGDAPAIVGTEIRFGATYAGSAPWYGAWSAISSPSTNNVQIAPGGATTTKSNTLDDGSTGTATLAGDLKVNVVGKGVYVKEGSNATMGVATMVAGTVTVSTNKVTASSRIQLTIQSLGTVTAPKTVGITARTAGTSFTITSADATDTSVIAWWIVEPA